MENSAEITTTAKTSGIKCDNGCGTIRKGQELRTEIAYSEDNHRKDKICCGKCKGKG